MLQTKATYEPLGAASERKRAASPWSPPEQRGFLWGHVYAAATGQEKTIVVLFSSSVQMIYPEELH